MTSAYLLQICLITSYCSNALLTDRDRAARVRCAKRPGSCWRARHRRALSAPASPPPIRRRRAAAPSAPPALVAHCRCLRDVPEHFVWEIMATVQSRRGTTNSLDAILAANKAASGDDTMPRDPETPAPSSPQTGRAQDEKPSDFVLQPWTSAAQRPLSATSETLGTRSRRSSSLASRNSNRLSLTLPIALPNSIPSRPAPSPSVPQTPCEPVGSPVSSPVDSDELIIAIAAQERRVLELREELSRAETTLKQLKNKWNLTEAHKVKASVLKHEPLISLSTDGDDEFRRRSAELERKKALLRGQQGAPREHKRKVIRGGHTRALSLLSPTKSEHDMPSHHDGDILRSSTEFYSRHNPNMLSKRATWAPRQSSPSNHAMKQIAQDFRHGLWTFVEDLRQATVGDEGISATSNRTSDFGPRLARLESDQDTIRASAGQSRGRIPFKADLDTVDDPGSKSSTGSFNERSLHRRSSTRSETKARKHFSWTPLTFDDVGDDDWSNWDSPHAGKTARWSGSTVSGDIIPAVPEKMDETESTL